MQYYSEEQRRKAVDLYFTEGYDSTKVTAELGYPSVEGLMKWVRRDPRWSPLRARGPYHHHDQATKLEAVKMRLSGRCSLKSVAVFMAE